MIHDAIILLWDYPVKSESSHPNQDFKEYTDHLEHTEKEIFLKILKIAKTHGLIRRFIKKYSFVAKEHVHYRHNKIVYSTSGLYAQSLSEGLDEILKPYQEHVMELENAALANPHLTLAYVLGSLEKFKFFLNTLSRILFSIKESKLYGCQILHVLHQHSLSGNKETALAIQRLLCIVHKAFYVQLCSWILYGELRDSQKEFFIQIVDKPSSSSPVHQASKTSSVMSSEGNQSEKTVESTVSSSERQYDYEINAMMLPYYIPLSLAQKILFIGKSVALFESSPMDQCAGRNILQNKITERDFNEKFTIWGDKEYAFHKTFEELKKSDSFDLYKLNMLVDEIKSCVTEHLWIIAGEQAGVLHELELMKDFFLLGRGELFLELLRLAAPILDSQPTLVGTRDINLAFNAAARAIFLGNNKDIEKFTFKIPYNKQNASESFISSCEIGIPDGWATVTLKYKVKWPLHLLFTPDVLHQYNKMFRFLLRLKKTQHDLHLMWHSFKETRKYGGSLWQLHNKLMFLMDHLQHYLQADVLESNYSKLKNEAENIKDFEELKKAHQEFLINILSQAFLLMSSNAEVNEGQSSDYRSNPVLSNIMEVLQLCDSVCAMANEAKSQEEEKYLVNGFTNRFDILVAKLLQLLTALRTQPCGMHLARLLMRLDFNRWFSSTAHLTQSVML